MSDERRRTEAVGVETRSMRTRQRKRSFREEASGGSSNVEGGDHGGCGGG